MVIRLFVGPIACSAAEEYQHHPFVRTFGRVIQAPASCARISKLLLNYFWKGCVHNVTSVGHTRT